MSVESFLDAWRVALRIMGRIVRSYMEFRVEFSLTVAIGAIWQMSVIVFATVLLGRFSGMGGWSTDAVLLLVGLRMLAHALYVLFFGRISGLTDIVQEGLMEAYLLRPMPVYRQVQLTYFPNNAIGDLVVGISLSTAAISRTQVHWTAPRIAFLVAAVTGGVFMDAAIFTALSSAALHYPAASYWSSWIEELMGTFGSYPLKILPGVVNAMFTFLVPLAFVAYLPTAVLTGNTHGLGGPVALAVVSPLIGVLAFLLSRRLWNWSLSHYTGVNG